MKVYEVIKDLESLIELLKTENQDTICVSERTGEPLKIAFISYDNITFEDENCKERNAIEFN